MLPLIFASNWQHESESIKISVNVDAEAKIVPSDDYYKFDYLNANLFLFPREDFRQKVISIIPSPNAKVSDSILYRWDKYAPSFPFSIEVFRLPLLTRLLGIVILTGRYSGSRKSGYDNLVFIGSRVDY